MEKLQGRSKKATKESWRKGASALMTVVPTSFSGVVMEALHWRGMVQMKLGLEDVMGLPARCPDCGKHNHLDHAMSCASGGPRIRCHNEVNDMNSSPGKLRSRVSLSFLTRSQQFRR